MLFNLLEHDRKVNSLVQIEINLNNCFLHEYFSTSELHFNLHLFK